MFALSNEHSATCSDWLLRLKLFQILGYFNELVTELVFFDTQAAGITPTN